MANSVGICTTNYLDTASVTKSSENAVYPASNVLDIQRRGKVWRTAGFWKIVSGANAIVFRETTGVDLTATVAAGSYTNTTLAAAIKAALEAAGDSTYTVTYLATGIWRIASNGGGGGGIFQLRFEAAGSTIEDILGFDSSAFTGALSYDADDIRLHTEEHLVFDFGVTTNPKAFCLVGDRNNPLRISPTASIKLQAALTDSWDTPALEITIPYADAALAVWDFEGLADVSPGYRFWRFVIVDRDNPRLYLEFGAAFLGDMISCTRGCAVFPLNLRGRDTSTVVVSESGQAYGLKRPKTKGIGLRFQALLKAESEAVWEHWETVGITDNWFLILDAYGAFTTTKENNVKLVRFAEDFEGVLGSYDNFSAQMALEEAL